MDKAIYSDAYYTETHVNWFNNPDLKLYERIVRYMSENSPSKSLIDVGCGNGNFVNFVDNSNSIDVVRIVGIDLAAIPTRGKIEMINGDIYQHNFNEKFDYVVTLAVIEHVSDVKRFVERLMSLCADNGHIVIMTVNEAGLLYSIAKILFYLGMRTPLRRLYDAHHIHHFTSSSLDELINRTPGLVIKEKCYHNIPMRSVDLPYKSRFMRFLAKIAVCGAFLLGKGFTSKTFLQTIFVQKQGV